MKHRAFYSILIILILFDSVLLASPNLLGKIGLIIYKYHYLRNFPRTLLTVSIVCGIFVLITFLIHELFNRQIINRNWTLIIFYFLIGLVLLYYVKLGYDFSRWSYRQTGWRFKSGVYLLPLILLYIVGYTTWLVKNKKPPVVNIQPDKPVSVPQDEPGNEA